MKRILIRMLKRLGLLHHFNFTVSFSRNGNTVRVPVLGRLGDGNLKISEQWMCEILEKLLPVKSGCFIDIGVNLGQTLIKLKLVDDEVRYLGFDPNPVCAYYVRELIRENNYDNAVIIPVGLSGKNELATLHFYSEGTSDSAASIIEDFRPNDKVYRKEFVACFDFENIKASVPDELVSVVKIDVEGSELEVLNGIRNLLIVKRPFILIEVLPVYNSQNVVRLQRQNELEKFVTDCNYKLFLISKSERGFNGFAPIETIGINARVEDSEYLLCPAEDAEKIKSIAA